MKKEILAMALGLCVFAQNPQSARYPGATATDNDLPVLGQSAQTTLNGDIDNAVTSIVLTDAARFVAPVIITIGTEKIFCTTRTSNTLSGCSRGYNVGNGATTASAHSSGATVYGYIEPLHFNQLAAEVKAIEANAAKASVVTSALAGKQDTITTGTVDQFFKGTFALGNLPSCSNATTSKLLYDTTTHAFTCGTDQNSGTGGSSAGAANAVQGGNGSGAFTDTGCTATGGAMTCSGGFIAGTSFSVSGAEQSVAGITNPSAGSQTGAFDSTSHTFQHKDSTGTVKGTTVVPKASRDTGKFVTNVDAGGVQNTANVAEGDIALSDVTTGNADATKHGWLPKLDGNAAHALSGAGTWVPFSTFSLPNASLGSGASSISRTATAGAGGVTAKYLVAKDTSDPTKRVLPSSGGCGAGVAATTATSGATFEMYVVGGTVITGVADNAITAGHVLVGGTTTPGRVRDSGQTSRTAISAGTCIVGVALQGQSTVGGDVLFEYDGPGTYGTSGVEVTANRTGNGSQYCTVTGALTSGNIITADANGNCVDSGTSLTSLLAAVANPFWNTASLVTAVEGNSYTQALSASGGTTPYTFSVQSGSLPTGLSISGSNITGTPGAGTSASSPYSITLRVTDNASRFADRAFTLAVNTAVAAPSFSPAAGAYNNAQSITITDSTSGATICYTTDGSTPAATTPGTCSTGSTYSTAVAVTSTGTTLKALGTKSGLVNSGVQSASYTLQVATPTADQTPGAIADGTTVNFASTTTSSTFHFTSGDGTQAAPTCSTGTTGSTDTIHPPVTYKVIGCKTNYADSAVASFAYTLTATPPAYVASSAASGAVAQGGSFRFTFPSQTVSGTGKMMAIAIGYKGSSGTNQCGLITDVTCGSDTYTKLVEASAGSGGTACAAIWVKYNASAGTCSPIAQGQSGSAGAFDYAIEQFTQGSLALTTDGTCTHAIATGTTVDCTSAITTTGTMGLGLAALYAYDNGAGTEAGTPSMTIPTNGSYANGSNGSIALSYYIGNPPAASVKPKFTGVGIGDPVALVGVVIK